MNGIIRCRLITPCVIRQDLIGEREEEGRKQQEGAYIFSICTFFFLGIPGMVFVRKKKYTILPHLPERNT